MWPDGKSNRSPARRRTHSTRRHDFTGRMTRRAKASAGGQHCSSMMLIAVYTRRTVCHSLSIRSGCDHEAGLWQQQRPHRCWCQRRSWSWSVERDMQRERQHASLSMESSRIFPSVVFSFFFFSGPPGRMIKRMGTSKMHKFTPSVTLEQAITWSKQKQHRRRHSTQARRGQRRGSVLLSAHSTAAGCVSV